MRSRRWSVASAFTAALLVSGFGLAGLALAHPQLSNTAVTDAELSALIPNPPTPAVPALSAHDSSISDGVDCVGSVQSEAFALLGGLFLYAYQLECNCGPNWDVGYAAAGGGLKVPLFGNAVAQADFNNDGVITGGHEDSFHTTATFFNSHTLDLAVFNQFDFFSTSSGDFTISANVDAGGTRVELLNANGIFFTGDVAGFVTAGPPQILAGAFLGGSNTVFKMVVPSPVEERLDKFFDPPKGQEGQGPDQIEIGQPTTTTYSYAIEYVNLADDTPPARLVDTVTAEFDVVSATVTPDELANDLSVFQTGKGKHQKSSTKITLDLPAGPQSARIDVVVQTRENPGKGHRGPFFKPTSCGLVTLNSDPVFVFEVDPETGEIRRDAEGNKVVLLGPSAVLDIVAVEDPTNPDNDGDGIPNDVEARELRTDPCDPDTDGDALPDGDEETNPSAIAAILPVCVVDGSSPVLFDTDGDGLGDGEEVSLGFNPGHPDMDFDGLKDGAEVALGTDPFNPDTDGDGVLDGADADPLNPNIQ